MGCTSKSRFRSTARPAESGCKRKGLSRFAGIALFVAPRRLSPSAGAVLAAASLIDAAVAVAITAPAGTRCLTDQHAGRSAHDAADDRPAGIARRQCADARTCQAAQRGVV